MLEATVEAYLIKKVHDLGGQIRKVRWIGRRGAPDRLVLFDKKATGIESFWVELKRPTGRVTEIQWREIQLLTASGFHAHIFRSKCEIDDFFSDVTRPHWYRAINSVHNLMENQPHAKRK